MNVAEFVYTTLLRPTWLRAQVNRLIIALLPASVRVGNAVVVLNPHDPVVSGALALGVYERCEIALVRRLCKPGQVMVDIGANVGLYTAIAGLALGPSGRVIAMEPEPESFSYLRKTMEANQLQNVQLVQAAASDENRRAKLFTSSANRGDHRLFQHQGADGSIEVETLCLDGYLQTQGVDVVDMIKIDVQGFEGHVVAGLERTIRASPSLIMLMEFWPTGLSAVGTDPVRFLQLLKSWGLGLYRISERCRGVPLGDPHDVVDGLHGRKYANLLALGPRAEGVV